jgi:hemolysin activation/secretion protein
LLSLSGVASFGLDALGARVTDPRLAESDFIKFNGRGSLTQQIAADWLLRLSASAQYGASKLPVSELYTIGGVEFGRAYPSASVLGDSGLAGFAELAWRPQQFPLGFRGSELYGFADAGSTWYGERLGFATQQFDAASAGGGVRLQLHEKAMLQFEAADALSTVAGAANAGDWRFSVSLRAAY